MKGCIKKKWLSVCWLLQTWEGITGLAVWTLKLKQELLAGHSWAGSAAEDSSVHLFIPSTQGARIWLQNESWDPWQASREREIPPAEKIQKWELHNFPFYSNLIVVKRTGSAQVWEYNGCKAVTVASRASLAANRLGFIVTFHIPWYYHHLALFVCLDLGWTKL